MDNQVIVLSGSSPFRLSRAFFHISLIARVAWGVQEEYFYVWPEESNMERIGYFSRAFQLVEIKATGNTKEKGDSGAAQELSWLSLREYEEKIATREQEEELREEREKREKLFAFDRYGPSKRGDSRKTRQTGRPPDAEFLSSLQELGVDETAKKYGRQPSTIVNVWVGAVEGAGDVLRNLSPKKRGTFRVKKKV